MSQPCRVGGLHLRGIVDERRPPGGRVRGWRRHRAGVDEERLPCGDELVGQLADPGDDRGCGHAGAGEAVPALRDRERLQSAVGGCDELLNARRDRRPRARESRRTPVSAEARRPPCRCRPRRGGPRVPPACATRARPGTFPRRGRGRRRRCAAGGSACEALRRAARATGVGGRQRRSSASSNPNPGRSGTGTNPSASTRTGSASMKSRRSGVQPGGSYGNSK